MALPLIIRKEKWKDDQNGKRGHSLQKRDHFSFRRFGSKLWMRTFRWIFPPSQARWLSNPSIYSIHTFEKAVILKCDCTQQNSAYMAACWGQWRRKTFCRPSGASGIHAWHIPEAAPVPITTKVVTCTFCMKATVRLSRVWKICCENHDVKCYL